MCHCWSKKGVDYLIKTITMASTLPQAPPTTSTDDTSASAAMPTTELPVVITVGRLVEVASRTWPGINRPGGVARVTRVYYDHANANDGGDGVAAVGDANADALIDPTYVDVSYMVGRSREKRVPVEYVTLAPQYETHNNNIMATNTTTTTSHCVTVATTTSTANNQQSQQQSQLSARRSTGLRDRSLLLGRCRRCGSLRADCGSCDWATEEADQEHTIIVGTSSHSKTASKSRRRQRSQEEDHGLYDSSESSGSDDDDDDDDIALQDLLKTSRKRYRTHVRHRKQWNRLINNEEQQQQEPKTRGGHDEDWNTQQPPTRQKERDTSMVAENNAENVDSDDDDDDDLEELLQRSQRKYRRHVRQRAKWQRRLLKTVHEEDEPNERHEDELPSTSSSKSTLVVKERRRGQHRSVLETLDIARNDASNRQKGNEEEVEEGPNTIIRRRQTKPVKHPSSRRVTLEKAQPISSTDEQEMEKDDDIVTTVHRTPQRTGRNAMDIDDERSPIGVADSSSPEPDNDGPTFPMDDDDDDDHDDLSPRREEQEQRRIASYLEDIHNDKNTMHDDSDSDIPPDDADNTFIQPEGREAAENLPDDMVDRTKSIPYIQLPDFFNTTAQNLEDRMLPDFCLRIADMQRKHRRLSSPRNINNNNNNDPEHLLQQCHQLWTEVTRRVIRNGTDQCRAALRRLSDDRLFRKHRKNLTLQQRKKIRGTTIMDARNLRLDALEDSVETMVRDLKNVAAGLEKLYSEQQDVDVGDNDQSDDDDDNGQVGFRGSSDEEGEDYETQDLIPLNQTMNEDSTLAPSERPLGEFDPHQHATKRRPKKRSHQEDVTRDTEARKSKSGRSDELTHKRIRTTSTPEEDLDDFIVADESTKRRPTSQSTRTSLSSAEGGRPATAIRKEHPNASRPGHGSRTAVGHRRDRPAQVAEADPISMEQIIDDEEIDDAPSSDFFDLEAGEDTVPDSVAPETSTRRPQRAAARQRRVSQDPSDSFLDLHQEASTQRDRVPISRRMQEFLDKNNELNWENDDEGNMEKNFASSKVDRRERLAQRKNRLTGHQHRGRDSGSYPQRDRSKDSNEPSVPRPSSTSAYNGSTTRADAIAPPSGDQISTEYLLSKLDATTSTSARLPSVSVPGTSVHSLSSQIRQSYPNNPVLADQLLRQIQPLIQNEIDPNGSTEICRTASDLLQAHGPRTLLEMIANRSPQLGAHVQLLSTLVRAGNDTVLQGKREDFISLLILQLVDAVFALIHPTGWAVNIPNRVGALALLEPIRDALAEAVPITEAVSRCIVEQLVCQEWRVTPSEDCMYVSSLDPSVWNRFVQSGECSIPQVPSRYHKLGKVWPRIEVDTVWNVLLFFGSATSRNNQTNQTRWQLITKLFSSSVLAKSTEEPSNLPPNPLQLRAFESDIHKFVRLIGKGSLDSLPGTDKLVANLIKKGIALQAEDYLGNEESRFRSFPALQTDRNTTRVVERLWKSTQSLLMREASSVEDDWQTVYDLNFQPLKQSEGSLKLKNLLLPNSRLLGGCLSLLVAWARRVPKKKVRQMRFLKQLKSLRESLAVQEKELAEQFSSKLAADAFANAFTDGRPIEIGNEKERVSLFFCETSAYLKILESILRERESVGLETPPGTKCLSLQALKELWESVACDTLLQHRQSLVENMDVCNELHLDDSLKLFIAGKTMATAAFLCMDISPWCLTAAYPRKRLSLGVDEHNGMIEYYSFPISCVFACVDCLSRSEKNSALLCHLYSIVTILCNQLTVTVKLAGRNPSLNRLLAEASSIYMPLLLGCFRRHVDAKDNDTSDALLRLILCSIRSLSTLVSARRLRQAPTGATITPDTVDETIGDAMASTSDDFFDDLDDSLFASIETNVVSSESQRVPNKDPEPYWIYMKQVLVLLKPSERFKISSSLDREEILSISAQGKYILNKEIDKVCDCLVSMAVAEKNGSGSESSLLRELLPLIHLSQQDGEDAEYEKKISARLSTQICLISPAYEECQDFVATNMDLFLFGIIQSLLDPDRLGVFPSCHFEVIRNAGGEGAAREALAALDIFNGEASSRPLDMSIENFESILHSQNRRRTRAELPWQLIESLGSGVSSRFGPFAAMLKDVDCDLPSSYEESLDAACLEKESFACFSFLRNVISGLAESHPTIFESMAAHIISFLATEVLRIVQGLRYFDQTNSGDSEEEPSGRTKIVSLFHAFSEIFIATAAWILRETPNGATKKWKSLQHQLCESLFFPLLRRQSLDMTLNLKLVIEACRSSSGSVLPSSTSASGIPGCVAYFEPYFDIALRRCRQLTVAPLQSSVLQNYLIEGIISVEAEKEVPAANLVGTCFCPTLPTNLILSPQGPLQEELDRYLFFIESERPRANWKRDMAEKRLETMRAVIIPKFAQRKAALDVRRKILRVSTHIFAIKDAFSDATSKFDMLELIASFVRPLRRTLVQCIMAKSIDDDLVSIAFSCAANIARLNVPNPFSEKEDTVLNQIDDMVSQMDSFDLAIVCQVEMRALYLIVFFQWMYSLGSKIAREELLTGSSNDDDGGDSLSNFCRLCARESLDHPDEHVLSDLVTTRNTEVGDDDSSKLEIWTKALVGIEEKIFASKSENARPVVNMYAKIAPIDEPVTEGSDNEPVKEPWKPTSGVARSAKEYMAAILTMSS